MNERDVQSFRRMQHVPQTLKVLCAFDEDWRLVGSRAA